MPRRPHGGGLQRKGPLQTWAEGRPTGEGRRGSTRRDTNHEPEGSEAGADADPSPPTGRTWGSHFPQADAECVHGLRPCWTCSFAPGPEVTLFMEIQESVLVFWGEGGNPLLHFLSCIM